MEIVNKIISKFEKELPKRIDLSNNNKFIQWQDYNYPKQLPLIYFNLEDIPDSRSEYLIDILFFAFFFTLFF